MFLDVGFADATMEAIAERAGVARANLYTRHADKLALLKAVVDFRLALWSDISAQTDWMLGESIEQRLRHYARSVVSWSRKEEVKAFERLLESATSPTIPSSELQRVFKAPMIDILTFEISEAGRRRNRFLREPDELAAIFFAMLSAYDREDVRDSEERMFSFADRVVDVFLNGIDGW